jgi:hypothetical protein
MDCKGLLITWQLLLIEGSSITFNIFTLLKDFFPFRFPELDVIEISPKNRQREQIQSIMIACFILEIKSMYVSNVCYDKIYS